MLEKLEKINEQMHNIEIDILKKQNELKHLQRCKKDLIEEEKLYNEDLSELKNKELLRATFLVKDDANNIFHVECTQILFDDNDIYANDIYNEQILFKWCENKKNYLFDGHEVNILGYYDLYEHIQFQ